MSRSTGPPYPGDCTSQFAVSEKQLMLKHGTIWEYIGLVLPDAVKGIETQT